MQILQPILKSVLAFFTFNFEWWIYSATHLRNLRYGQLYGALSNIKDLSRIRTMIDDNATVYGYHGPTDIMEGMDKFYQTYHNVFWTYPNGFRIKSMDIIEFDFDRYWTDKDSGSVMRCQATEFIRFTSDGMIAEIDYTRRPENTTVTDYPLNKEKLLQEAFKYVDDHVNTEF
eukprot:gene10057-20954_t